MTTHGRVLVVEHSLETLLQVGSVLESAGYQALGTSDPEEAKSLVEREELSVVVLGVQLARISRRGLLAELRAIPAGTFLPVLFLFTQSDATEGIDGSGSGIDDFLVQPFSPAELVMRLGCLIQRRQYMRSALCGGLEVYPLADLAQSIALGRWSGALEIAGKAAGGRLHFRYGELIEASAGRRQGEAAVEALLEIQSGEFCFRPGERPDVPGTEHGLGFQRLLLDAAWLSDELRRRQQFLPASDQILVSTGRPLNPASSETRSLPLSAILNEVERTGAVTLGELVGLNLGSRRRVRLGVAWLIEHEVLAEAASARDSSSAQEPWAVETSRFSAVARRRADRSQPSG